jgi:hypothetical protein
MLYYFYVASGYFYAVTIGSLLIKLVVDRLWISIGRIEYSHDDIRPNAWTAVMVGVVERVLFVTSIRMGYPEFIGVWIILKATGQWKRWQDDQEADGIRVTGRSIYNIFLIGNGLSIAFSVVAVQSIDWLVRGRWIYATATSLSLVLMCVFLYLWCRHHSYRSIVLCSKHTARP